jgi:hypothetical protein
MFTRDRTAVPAFAVVDAGTVTVDDLGTVNASATAAPTLTFGQQTSGFPILQLLGGSGFQREITENWSLMPVNEPERLRRLRCALRILVAGETGDECDDCERRLKEVYLGPQARAECLIPRGWYSVGGKKDVPKTARYVGCYDDTYVWVTSEGLEGLSRFTLTMLDLATTKPNLPQKTVQKTFKPDGKLESIQVTTTELDQEALEKLRNGELGLPAQENDTGQFHLSPGLFFQRR